MPVLIRSEGVSRRSVRSKDVRMRAVRMLSALGRSDLELSVLLCGDARIHELNKAYREMDKPTDVLAFPLIDFEAGEEPTEGALLGDVVISLDTARRQAAQGQRTIIGEVTFLLAHGLLHLLGQDHRDRDEERRMTARTEILVHVASTKRVVDKAGG